jgi:hypothetical protein
MTPTTTIQLSNQITTTNKINKINQTTLYQAMFNQCQCQCKYQTHYHVVVQEEEVIVSHLKVDHLQVMEINRAKEEAKKICNKVMKVVEEEDDGYNSIFSII